MTIILFMARFCFFSCVLCLVMLGCGPKKPTDANYVLVKGDGVRVERKDLDNQVRDKLQKEKIREADSPELQDKLNKIAQEGLEEALERDLLRQEAKRLGLWDEAVKSAKAEMNKFRVRYATREDREKFFNSIGIDENLFEERVEDRFVRGEIEKKMGFKKPKSDEIESIQQSDKAMIDAMASRILIQQVQVGAKASKEGGKALSKGEQKNLIENLAKQWRDTGTEPWPELKDGEGKKIVYQRLEYPIQTVPTSLKAAAAKLKPGEFSGVITDKDGYLVLRAMRMSDWMRQRQAKQKAVKIESVTARQAQWDQFIAQLKDRYHVETVGKIERL